MKPRTSYLLAPLRWIGISLTFVSIVAWTFGQNQSRVLLRDKASNVLITNYNDFVLKRVSEKRVRVIADGSPLQVAWSRDGMTMQSATFEGLVETVEKGTLNLVSALLRGNVKVQAQRGTDLKRSLVLTTGSANYDAAERSFTLQSSVELETWDSQERLRLVLKGTSGRFLLYPNPMPKTARSILQSGTLQGPVSFDIRTKSATGEVGTLKGSCRELLLNDPDGILTLKGNVSITGDSPLLFGDIKASRADIILNAAGEPDEIRVFGDPVTTQVDKKKPAPPKTGGPRL